MRRIIAQMRKELTQIVRDWRTLALALALPMFLLVLMSSALSLTVNEFPLSCRILTVHRRPMISSTLSGLR
jgi:hypothetical protein